MESRAPVFGRPQKGEGFQSQRIVVLPQPLVRSARMHPLLCGLLPTDIGFFPNAKGHLRERPVGVDQMIVIYCAKGSGWCELRGLRHEVTAGSLIVLPPREPHAYGTNTRGPWTISWFHAVGDDIRSMIEELGASAENPVLPLKDDSRWLALFGETLETLEHGYTNARPSLGRDDLAPPPKWRRCAGRRRKSDALRGVHEAAPRSAAAPPATRGDGEFVALAFQNRVQKTRRLRLYRLFYPVADASGVSAPRHDASQCEGDREPCGLHRSPLVFQSVSLGHGHATVRVSPSA